MGETRMMMSMRLLSLSLCIAVACANNITIYKLNYPASGECGQTSMAASQAKFPLMFGGFKKGLCSSAGYPTAAGQQKMCHMGHCQMFDVFKKAAVVEPMDDVTLYKVQGAECGQLALSSKIAPYAEKMGGLKEGTCASQGYTVADGTQTMKIPVVGTEVTIHKFK